MLGSRYRPGLPSCEPAQYERPPTRRQRNMFPDEAVPHQRQCQATSRSKVAMQGQHAHASFELVKCGALGDGLRMLFGTSATINVRSCIVNSDNPNTRTPEDEPECLPCALQGYDQKVIEVLQSAQAEQELVATLDYLDQPLISPFQPDQPSERQLRLHTPARFSKQVIEGIRHAAGKLFKVRGPQCLEVESAR